MPLGLTKNAPPLLRMARGKRHATDDHHDEPVPRTKSSTKEKRKMETEEDINAEPASSDDDGLHVPAPRPPKSKLPTPERIPDPDLHQPQRKSRRKRIEIRPPASGAFERARAHKAKKANEHNKENTTLIQSSPGDMKDSVFGFDLDELNQPPSKKQKQTTTYGGNKKSAPVARNIHAPPPKKAAPRSSKKTYSRSSQEVPQYEDDDDESDVSMMEVDKNEREKAIDTTPKQVDDPELRTKKPRKRSAGMESLKSPTALNEDEVRKLLDEQSKSWQHDRPPLSSQPDSSTPQEALDNISEYQFQLPPEEEEGTRCGLCKGPVISNDYWEFWTGKEKTMKNLTAFCHVHKKKSAQKEYDEEGFPPINWDAIPGRIFKHRMKLFKILNGTSKSKHRDVYEPLALTGKAAAVVPSRRQDLPAALQQGFDSYNIDDQSTYPGYYGPHGRRVITEIVTEMFANEIKNSKDLVLQGSGPAAFVQAVMVPETAILLIMEDCQVDREAAEEIRDRTYEMGLLLHEEVEDEVELQDEDGSEDENEYHAA